MKFTMRSPCVHAFVKQDSCSFMLHVLFRFFVLSAVEGSNTRDLSFFSLQSDLSFFLVFQRFTTVSVFSHDSFCARASRCK